MEMLSMDAVFGKIETAAVAWGLDVRQTNTLRLLGEEMVGMTENLVDVTQMDFFVESVERAFSLHLTAKANISPEKKRTFVETSSKKVNLETKGLKGKMKSLFEDLLYFDPDMPPMPLMMEGLGYWHDEVVWNMTDYYRQTLSSKAQKEDWDGLEKSILLHLADDISIGATTGQVEMIVKKKF